MFFLLIKNKFQLHIEMFIFPQQILIKHCIFHNAKKEKKKKIVYLFQAIPQNVKVLKFHNLHSDLEIKKPELLHNIPPLAGSVSDSAGNVWQMETENLPFCPSSRSFSHLQLFISIKTYSNIISVTLKWRKFCNCQLFCSHGYIKD